MDKIKALIRTNQKENILLAIELMLHVEELSFEEMLLQLPLQHKEGNTYFINLGHIEIQYKFHYHNYMYHIFYVDRAIQCQGKYLEGYSTCVFEEENRFSGSRRELVRLVSQEDIVKLVALIRTYFV